MMKMKQVLMAASFAIPALAMSGCGMGKKLVKELSFATSQEGGHLIAGFDTKVEMGNGSLPEVKLPIYNPSRPSQFLGYVETHYDGGISVRIDVTDASKLKTTDGRLPPNGREIPVSLPSDVVPIGIPVINSSSKVYLAVGKQNLLAGVAVTLVADTSTGSSRWLRILQQLPTNIFYPFTIANDLKGTAGLFTGDKVGVGVFAVKTMKPATTILGGEGSNGQSFAVSRMERVVSEAKAEVFGVKTQYPIGYKMMRIRDALQDVRDTAID